MAATRLTIYLAQVNPLVGDIDGNCAMIVDVIERAQQQGADLVLFPELAVTGYPPEDLLLRPSIHRRVSRALDRIATASAGITTVVGYPAPADPGRLYNAAGVFRDGQKIAEYHKQFLPNYQVFDELRYFVPGREAAVFEVNGIPVAVNICEDLWYPEPARQAAAAGARLLVNINASPFDMEKLNLREEQLIARSRETGLPIVYVNQVGGQDELVFDGASLIVDGRGVRLLRGPLFDSWEQSVDLLLDDDGCRVTAPVPPPMEPVPSREALVYRALVSGVRDYVNKNRFPGVVLGLSGGIDSALTLAVAVDALGPERVEAVMMPFRYTSQLSLDVAAKQAETLGINYRVIGIEHVYDAFMQALSGEFAGLPVDVAEQNLQARCRGVILMAISNKKGSLVLTTGNKSEVAVGYATLYGDMAGGFDVLKDVPKTLVYRLATHLNEERGREIIPHPVIERPPSAELAPDQKDSDSLPDYPVLDAILERYIERDQSAAEIVAAGFDEEQVRRVVRLVDINEYKRRQAAVGVRVTGRGFGRDRRYPITNGWPPGD